MFNRGVLIVPYIPHSCSLVWLQEDSPELTGVKIYLSFTPRWFSRRMELDYGKRWHTDPIYRRDRFVEMAKVLNREFPALKPGGDPSRIKGGLSQIHTCAPMAALFGQGIQYGEDRWPDNTGQKLDDDAVSALEVPEFRNHWVYEDLLRQIRIIEREWGAAEGELNLQGVLNTAFRLRGEKLFIDMRLEPERAHHVLNVVCDAMISFNDELARLQAGAGYIKRHFVTSNCVVNMISGDDYREFVMPYDRRLHDHYELFGIHNCGWCVDAYADAYAEIGRILYLDFGIDSDLRRLKSLFPHTVLTLIYNPQDMAGKNIGELSGELSGVREALGECAIILGSMDEDCPNSMVTDFFSAAGEVWRRDPADLVPWVPCS